MSQSPYHTLPRHAFWRTGVAEADPAALQHVYRKKWQIPTKWNIATAGSCFAQHVAQYLRDFGYKVMDLEPPPPGLPSELHGVFGYSMYSARYGNIYTVRQLLQLAQEAAGLHQPAEIAWQKAGKYYDALRPGVEPEGLDSIEEVKEHRSHHVAQVATMFRDADLFIFTLGLTEAWVHKETGTVFPTAPGTIAGEFDPDRYEFKNFDVTEVLADFKEFQQIVAKIRGGRSLLYLLTVSPVPLTATASGHHVLCANALSKSILRAAAGQLAASPHIDYFPSFEILTNQAARGMFYAPNLRSITAHGVELAMKAFFAEHASGRRPLENRKRHMEQSQSRTDDDTVPCEEALLEAFAR